MEYPKLRPIDAFPADLGGREVICPRDPTQLADDAVLTPREALLILAYFDGKYSILDIQAAYTRRHGRLLSSDAINGLIAMLDESLLMDNERFKAHGNQLFCDQVAQDDQVVLTAAAQLDTEGSFQVIAEHYDRRRICGFPPTYLLLSTIPATAGTVFTYSQAVEPATQSMVSYASVVFH